MKVVIIGGVAGGATAAARIRRLDEDTEIIIFERSGFVSYANCALPYYIGDEITDKNNLLLASPSYLYNRYRINVKVIHEVIDINSLDKKVIVKNLDDGSVFEETYDKLLLSPGAKPVNLPFLNKPLNNVFTLRTVEDTFKIKEHLNANKIKNVGIVGGGFIGIEMAENIHKLGIDVTIIQKDSQLLSNIDRDIISFVHNNIRRKNVGILLNKNVLDVLNVDKKVIVKLNDSSLEFDMLIVCIGVTPDNSLAIKAGLELGDKGAISVDTHMQTSIKDIYAVGDAVLITHKVLNKKKVVSLAGPANKEARVAADNICGINSEYKGTLATNVIKIFDMTFASTGISEKEAITNNFNYEKVFLSPFNHATYYPNAKQMSLKVIYEKETLKILGAQAVGYEGVEKRIDVIATLMFADGDALMLKDLDLSYAPPYSSAKDPVNMAGFIIDNIETGLVKQFFYDDLEKLSMLKDVILLDTRTQYEYEKGHASGFINIPLDDLREKLDLLDKNKKIYIMCQSGLRSYLAARILMNYGYDAYNFSGGYRLYSSIKLDI